MESSRVLKICIAALIICTTLIVTVGVLKIRKINSEKEVILSEAFNFTNMLEDIKLELDVTNSDEFVEKTAREDLGLVKPGEELVIVAEPLDDETYSPIQSPIPDLEIGD